MDFPTLLNVLWPELVLVVAACALFIFGIFKSTSSRRIVPLIALAVLVALFVAPLIQSRRAVEAEKDNPILAQQRINHVDHDGQHSLAVGSLATYVKLITAGMGILFVLLAWPSNSDATGNVAIEYGFETGEFFGLMLMALAGVFLVASANDTMLLFLGIELASLPTYIMVSMSRPLPMAQEAGVKYFFLGAMSAAIMLFGFSYLYGTTGTTRLDLIAEYLHGRGSAGPNAWQIFAVVMVLAGLAFKIAAVPLHAYAGDVYQGAATPVTALLAYVPKTSGFIAIIKILAAVGGQQWLVPDVVFKLLWVIAVLTMTFGNALGLLQFNIKRVLAYSSVAHSGYMLVGLTALVAARAGEGASHPEAVQTQALGGVLFYLAAYGIMNTGAFGVLMLLPGRTDALGRHGPNGEPLPTATSAETFEDIAGAGRRHPSLGLAMSICCFSLTGLPLTIGFFGKVLLVAPVVGAMSNPTYRTMMVWLVVIMMLNAAVSAAYYLRIVAALFLRTESTDATFAGSPAEPHQEFGSLPITAAVVLSVVGTLFYGIFFPATDRLTQRAERRSHPNRRAGNGDGFEVIVTQIGS